jgi:hypothetical protein
MPAHGRNEEQRESVIAAVVAIMKGGTSVTRSLF